MSSDKSICIKMKEKNNVVETLGTWLSQENICHDNVDFMSFQEPFSIKDT